MPLGSGGQSLRSNVRVTGRPHPGAQTGSLTGDNIGGHTQGTHGDTRSFSSPTQFIEITPKGSAVPFLHASLAGMFSEVRREEPDCPCHPTGGCRNPTDPPPDVPVHPDPRTCVRLMDVKVPEGRCYPEVQDPAPASPAESPSTPPAAERGQFPWAPCPRGPLPPCPAP